MTAATRPSSETMLHSRHMNMNQNNQNNNSSSSTDSFATSHHHHTSSHNNSSSNTHSQRSLHNGIIRTEIGDSVEDMSSGNIFHVNDGRPPAPLYEDHFHYNMNADDVNELDNYIIPASRIDEFSRRHMIHRPSHRGPVEVTSTKTTTATTSGRLVANNSNNNNNNVSSLYDVVQPIPSGCFPGVMNGASSDTMYYVDSHRSADNNSRVHTNLQPYHHHPHHIQHQPWSTWSGNGGGGGFRPPRRTLEGACSNSELPTYVFSRHSDQAPLPSPANIGYHSHHHTGYNNNHAYGVPEEVLMRYRQSPLSRPFTNGGSACDLHSLDDAYSSSYFDPGSHYHHYHNGGQHTNHYQPHHDSDHHGQYRAALPTLASHLPLVEQNAFDLTNMNASINEILRSGPVSGGPPVSYSHMQYSATTAGPRINGHERHGLHAACGDGPSDIMALQANMSRQEQINLMRPLAITDSNGKREERYSRKVFVGGLPPDIDEEEIIGHFRDFGPLLVDWPHKAESKSYFPPKGYAFLIYSNERSVQNLIESCVLEDTKLYMCVSSPSIKDKPVQIRPWLLSDSDYVMDGSQPLDPRKTIFVGGVPRPLRAVELAMIMNSLYGGVCYAGIDTDPELKYPKGAGRVAFSNQQSYISAISARFVQLRHGEIDKRVEVKPYVLDDQVCDECQGSKCNGKFAPFFCANVTCLQYYCDVCWGAIHSRSGREYHKPLVKEGAERPRSLPFRWN